MFAGARPEPDAYRSRWRADRGRCSVRATRVVFVGLGGTCERSRAPAAPRSGGSVGSLPRSYRFLPAPSERPSEMRSRWPLLTRHRARAGQAHPQLPARAAPFHPQRAGSGNGLDSPGLSRRVRASGTRSRRHLARTGASPPTASLDRPPDTTFPVPAPVLGRPRASRVRSRHHITAPCVRSPADLVRSRTT